MYCHISISRRNTYFTGAAIPVQALLLWYKLIESRVGTYQLRPSTLQLLPFSDLIKNHISFSSTNRQDENVSEHTPSIWRALTGQLAGPARATLAMKAKTMVVARILVDWEDSNWDSWKRALAEVDWLEMLLRDLEGFIDMRTSHVRLALSTLVIP